MHVGASLTCQGARISIYIYIFIYIYIYRCMYTYMNICIYIYTHMCIFTYILLERERERATRICIFKYTFFESEREIERERERPVGGVDADGGGALDREALLGPCPCVHVQLPHSHVRYKDKKATITSTMRRYRPQSHPL